MRTLLFLPHWAFASLAMSVLALPTSAIAQYDNEWEESSPYYEDDAWYDISEWFDGNDYNPVDERAGVWNDETYDPSVTSSDRDNDRSYDYGTDQTDRDYRTRSDQYSYDYDTTDNQTRSETRNRQQGGTSYFQGGENDNVYEYSAIFYDFDQDGLYDAMHSLYDWDQDGTFEDANFVVFNWDTGQQQGQSQQARQGSDSKQQVSGSRKHRIEGKVTSKRTAKVQGQQHVLVTVQKQNDDKKFLVDLGPKKNLQNLDLAEQDKISARGPVVKAAGRQIMLAERVQTNGQTQKIDRSREKLTGTIASLKTAESRGKQRQLAILETEDGSKSIVDLGLKDRLNVDLQEDDQITVHGAPVKIQDKRVVLAFKVKHDGETVTIDRRGSEMGQASGQQARRQQQGQSNRQQARSIVGEVIQTKTISVRGKQRQAATLETNQGEQIMVDLGPKGQSKLDLREGDRLTVRGPMIRANDQRIVLATSVRQNDDRTKLRSPSEQPQRTVKGEVQNVRTAEVRGESRKLAKLKTEEGNTILVDLGPAGDLQADLSQGDQITARGAAVKAGDQQVLVAFELTKNGGETFSIDRGRMSRR